MADLQRTDNGSTGQPRNPGGGGGGIEGECVCVFGGICQFVRVFASSFLIQSNTHVAHSSSQIHTANL